MNNYQQIIDYLFALQRFGIKLTLENITTLSQPLDNPQNNWPCIHIAGTNGKGSTAAMLESVLMKAGYKIGLYTSPHLVDFRERIRINRNHIPQEDVISFTIKMKDLIEEITPSFFEVATAMAFWYFSKEEIDIAIIEVGLGGRLDSTNVVNPLVSIITNVDMDHQKYLGNTIQEIAAEKAGIIKSGIPCITNNINEQVVEVLSKKCLSKNSELIKINQLSKYKIISRDLDGTKFNLKIGADIFNALHLNLPGEHQIENAILAIGTLLYLKSKLKISEKDISDGLRDVQWRGRINLVSREPFIIVDVSHNTSGFERTLSFLNNFFPKERLKVITALQEDKDFEKIGDLLSYYSENVYLVNLKLGKPLLPSKLADVLKQKGVNSKIINSINDIESEIRQLKQKNNFWLIIGSHYLAGEAYQNFKSLDFYN
jgi:dihydrofolate synthase/folylpolyglutamate synthase